MPDLGRPSLEFILNGRHLGERPVLGTTVHEIVLPIPPDDMPTADRWVFELRLSPRSNTTLRVKNLAVVYRG